MTDELPSPTDAPSAPSYSADDLSAFALQKLIIEIVQGSDRVFACFYDQLADKSWGLACRVLRDRTQADEITQEVFTELWRTAARHCPEQGSVTSWAMTLTHRRAVDWARSAEARIQRERRVTFDATRNRPFDPVNDRVLDNEPREQVTACLDQLTERQRETAVLAYYESLTCREIAETRQLPPGTVTSRLHDALHCLRGGLGVGHNQCPQGVGTEDGGNRPRARSCW